MRRGSAEKSSPPALPVHPERSMCTCIARYAALVQAVAAALVSAAAMLAGAAGAPPLGLGVWAAAQGLLAFAAARLLQMEPWWQAIHLGFAPALVAAHALDPPPALALAAFCALVLVFGAVHRHRVPLYFTDQATIAALGSLLPARRGFRMLDLGSGIGTVLHALHRLRPDGHYTGIEAALLPYWISCARRRRARADYELQRGDLWSVHLGGYDVVYAFLSPEVMPRLMAKALREMKPGSLLVSNRFAGDDTPAPVEVPVSGGRTVLYVWRFRDSPLERALRLGGAKPASPAGARADPAA